MTIILPEGERETDVEREKRNWENYIFAGLYIMGLAVSAVVFYNSTSKLDTAIKTIETMNSHSYYRQFVNEAGKNAVRQQLSDLEK